MWHSQIGKWMTDSPTKEIFYQRMKKHIQAIVSRYKDVVYCWDVVNEAMTDDKNAIDPYRQSAMYKLCGDEFIAKAFQYARVRPREEPAHLQHGEGHEAGRCAHRRYRYAGTL